MFPLAVGEKVGELISEVEKGLNEHGGQVLDLLLQTTYWKGFVYLSIGAFWLVLSIVCLSWCLIHLKRAGKELDWDCPFSKETVPPLVTGVLSAVSFCVSLSLLLNVHNWLSVISPKVALVNMFLERLQAGN